MKNENNEITGTDIFAMIMFLFAVLLFVMIDDRLDQLETDMGIMEMRTRHSHRQ